MKLIAIPLFTLIFAGTSFAEVTIPKDWPRMEPGLFEADMDMSGMQHKTTMCLTKEDMEDTEKNMAQDSDCKVTKAVRSGNSYTVDMDCKDPDGGKPMHMHIVTTLISKSQSVSKMQATQGGQQKMAMQTKMKRLRACTKEEALKSERMKAGKPSSADAMDQLKDMMGGDKVDKLKDLMKNMEF